MNHKSTHGRNFNGPAGLQVSVTLSQKTQVNLHVNLVNNLEGSQKQYRGSGQIETNITAAGLQIEEEAEFGKSELGGAIRKAIDDAIDNIE